jgi:hypothetical protein
MPEFRLTKMAKSHPAEGKTNLRSETFTTTSTASLEARNQPDLPVEAPTKYELVTMGLEIPSTLLARVDEVIE